MMIDWNSYVFVVGPLLHWGGGSEAAESSGGQLCYTVNIRARLDGTANVQGTLSGTADMPECE